MSVGQILSDMFGTVKARFGSMLGLWAIYVAITVGLFVLFGIGMAAVGIAGFAALGDSDALAAGAGIGMLVFFALFYVGYLLVAMAQYASLISMASPVDRPTIGTAFNAGWRAAPALVLLMIVLIVGYIALTLPLSLFADTLSSAGDTGGALLALALVPLLVWLGCRLAPLFAVITVDRVRNPFTAIVRSWRLTRGHALTIFLASLVFTVILIVLCGALLVPSFGLVSTMADPSASGAMEASGIGAVLLLFVSMLLLSLLFNLLYCSFMAVIHGSLTEAAGEGLAQSFA